MLCVSLLLTVGPPAASAAPAHRAVSVSSGDAFSCALTKAGGVQCWGENDSGQLGNGSKQDSAVPVQVQGLESGVRSVTASWWHACAVLDDGGVKCWGSGELGDGTWNGSSVPVDVQGLSGPVTEVAGGWIHLCALIESGAVECWGTNSDGQLGTGKINDGAQLIATPVEGLKAPVTTIAAGDVSTCAVLRTRAAYCWGGNEFGQLGDGTQKSRGLPVRVKHLKNARSIATEGWPFGAQSCATRGNGTVKCWGYQDDGSVHGSAKLTPVKVRRGSPSTSRTRARASSVCEATQRTVHAMNPCQVRQGFSFTE
jgi:alpha-tubulin suppressor-like RCC1 family protein